MNTAAEIITLLEERSDVETARLVHKFFRIHPTYREIYQVALYGHINAAVVGKSIDATVAILKAVLPGWTYRVAECCVSDDAWVIPDFNHPEHGERLLREFGQVDGDPSAYWQNVTDIDLRPAGAPAIALLLAIFSALEKINKISSCDQGG